MEHHLKYDTELVACIRTQPSTPEINVELQRQMLLGDVTAQEELALRNLPLAVSLVSAFLRATPQYTYLRDDLIGDSFLALVTAVEQLKTLPIGKAINPTNYVSRTVRNSIKATVLAAPVIRSHKHATQQNIPVTVSIDDAAVAVADPAVDCSDLRDVIDTCCETDHDREFTALREAGHTYSEIASLTRVPRRTVINHVHAVRDKVYQCLKESS
jgi:DNA-directed RNA polymerase specialized sigma24 family protein